MANSSSGEKLLDRLVRVLEAFAPDRPELTVAQIAERADLPRTTAYRLVQDCLAVGFLTRQHGTLRLGVRLWELANRASATRDLRQVAMPFLEDLNQLLRQHVQLSVLHEDEVLILERHSRPGAAINNASVASRLPVHRTSMGMVLLAFAPAPVQAGYIGRHEGLLAARHGDVRRELAEIRRRGYATFDGLIDPTTTGAAAPVLGPDGAAVAAIGVVIPRDSDSLQVVAMALMTAARGIGRALQEGAAPN
ncbi:IclR family transcriptional regulator [Zhihengliuella flava]|uniref:DNA-binding IclR family transcriptional regulator n=1 Tax=Zhihengliuella flava TaxID=1285193 RepID=A0A931D8G0_9MICC|nr:IclR family transcriptional regulator [Zhihengliuella flava]MBG6084352.1 DNA-binding IclR family transcriptional regulator [Zhihengliuella flava]